MNIVSSANDSTFTNEIRSIDLLPHITIISVCYRSSAVVGRLISSVPSYVPIILVCNGDEDDYSAFSSQSNVTLLKLNTNVGFGAGCNAGARIAQTEWLFFVNPDVELQEDTLEELRNAAQRYPNVSAFNPRILDSRGKDDFRRRSYLLGKKDYLPKQPPAADQEVPILHGSALFVSANHFNAIGGFDENIFLFHEDDDISLRLKARGPLMYVRDACVKHVGGGSSPRTPDIARFKAYHLAKSRIYTGRKHGRTAPVVSAVLDFISNYLAPWNLISKRKRAKAAGYYSGIVSEL